MNGKFPKDMSPENVKSTLGLARPATPPKTHGAPNGSTKKTETPPTPGESGI